MINVGSSNRIDFRDFNSVTGFPGINSFVLSPIQGNFIKVQLFQGKIYMTRPLVALTLRVKPWYLLVNTNPFSEKKKLVFNKICMLIPLLIICLVVAVVVAAVSLGLLVRSRGSSNRDSEKVGRRMAAAWRRWRKQDKVLEGSLGETAKKALGWWKKRIPTIRLLGSCLHRTWVTTSDIDMAVRAESRDEMTRLAKVIQEAGGIMIHEADMVKIVPFALFEDRRWDVPVDITISLMRPPIPGVSKYLPKDSPLELTEEYRFLVAYLKENYPQLKLAIKRKREKEA